MKVMEHITYNQQVAMDTHTLNDKVLTNILLELLNVEENIDDPNSLSHGLSNDLVEFHAINEDNCHFQNLCGEQGNLSCEENLSPTNGSTTSVDHLGISDLMNALPVILHKVQDEEGEGINISLGFPIAWWDYMEFGTMDEAITNTCDARIVNQDENEDANDEYQMCIADFINTLPFVLSEVHDKGIKELYTLGFPDFWYDYVQSHVPKLDTI